jgi:hypothetical protein
MGKLLEFKLKLFSTKFAKFLRKTIKFLFHKIGREKETLLPIDWTLEL